MSDPKIYLRIRNLDTNELVHSIAIRSLSQRHVEKVMSGILRNLRDDCYIDDSEVEAAQRAERNEANE